jgi:hypothetical protein
MSVTKGQYIHSAVKIPYVEPCNEPECISRHLFVFGSDTYDVLCMYFLQTFIKYLSFDPVVSPFS